MTKQFLGKRLYVLIAVVALLVCGGGGVVLKTIRAEAPKPPAPTEVILTPTEQGNIPALLKDMLETQQKFNEAQLKFNGAVSLVKNQKGLDETWDPASDDKGGIKFMKKPANPGAAKQ